MQRVFVGLGSNLANPATQIRQAIQALKSLPLTSVPLVSSCYRSLPWGGLSQQPDFLNAVVGLITGLGPFQLLNELQQIEKKQNRVKTKRWGPRTIDADILLFEGVELHLPQLTIPHLYLEKRAFVVVPLAEIAPGLVLPSGISAQALAETMGYEGLVKLEEVCH